MNSLIEGLQKLAMLLVAPIANVCARVYVGLEFFRSGMTKIEDFETTVEMFEEEWIVPFLSPQVSAVLATVGELALPVLLILGIFTRFAAAGLLVMAIVIEFIVFNGSGEYAQHYYWMIIFAMLVGYGGDKLSVDNLIRKKNNRYQY